MKTFILYSTREIRQKDRLRKETENPRVRETGTYREKGGKEMAEKEEKKDRILCV